MLLTTDISQCRRCRRLFRHVFFISPARHYCRFHCFHFRRFDFIFTLIADAAFLSSSFMLMLRHHNSHRSRRQIFCHAMLFYFRATHDTSLILFRLRHAAFDTTLFRLFFFFSIRLFFDFFFFFFAFSDAAIHRQ